MRLMLTYTARGFFFILLGVATLLNAQEYLAPGITVYGGNNGLNQTTVTDVAFDHRGVLWVATYGGLHYFDGFNFTAVALPADSARIGRRQTIRSVVSGATSLWVTDTKEVFELDVNRLAWQRTISRPELSGCVVLSATENELLLYGFSRQQLITYGIESEVVEVVETHKFTRNMTQVSASGDWLCLAAEKSFLKYKISEMGAPYRVDVPSDPTCVKVVDNGAAFVASAHALWMETSEGRVRKLLSDFESSSFSVTLWQHRYWVFADEKVWQFSEQGDLLIGPGHDGFSLSGVPIMYAYHALRDQSNNLWIARDGLGMMRISRHWSTLNMPPSFDWRNRFIRCLYDDGKNLYAGTEKGHLLMYDEEGNTSSASVAPGHTIWLVHRLSDDCILVGGSFGLVELDRNHTIKRTLRSLPPGSTGFRAACSIGRDLLIVGNEESLLVSTSANSDAPHIQTLENPALRGKNVARDESGRVWVAHPHGGLSRWFKVSAEEQLPDTGFGNINVLDLAAYRGGMALASADGPLFISSTDQLMRLHDPSLQAIPDLCYAVVNDLDDRLWFSTNNGLVCIEGFDGPHRRFKSIHGLQNNEFNQGCAVIRSDGKVVLGGVNGINCFDPGSINTDAWSPLPIMIESRHVHPVSRQQSTDQSARDAFRFIVPHYSDPASNAVWFSLLRNELVNDTLWQRMPNGSTIILENLKPGGYRLLVKGESSEGVMGQVHLVRAFNVLPVFYQRWWFRSLSTVVFIAIVMMFWLAHHRRKSDRMMAKYEQQQALQLMRQGIADDLHDDLGAGLTRLTLLSDQLALRYPQIKLETKRMGKLTRELTQSLRETVTDIRTQPPANTSLVTEVRNLAFDLFNANDVQYVVDATPPSSFESIRSDVQQCLWLVTKEAMNNIAKHSAATSIKWEGTADERALRVVIEDNGCGFDLNVTKHQGIASMRRRLQKLNGALTIDSQPGGPTRVFIEIKL